MRVFDDRLINADDHGWFKGLVSDKLQEYFSMEYEEVVDGSRRLIYGDYMVPGADPKIYEEVVDMDRLKSTVEEYLDEAADADRAVVARRLRGHGAQGRRGGRLLQAQRSSLRAGGPQQARCGDQPKRRGGGSAHNQPDGQPIGRAVSGEAARRDA